MSICQVRPTRGRPPALVCISNLLTTEYAIPFACTPTLGVLARSVARFVIDALPRANLAPLCFQDKTQHHEKSTTDSKPRLQPSHDSSVQGCRSRRAPPDAHVPTAKGVVAWLRRGRSGCMLFETCLDVYPFGWSTVGLLSVEEVIDQPSVRCARPKSTDLEYASSKYSYGLLTQTMA